MVKDLFLAASSSNLHWALVCLIGIGVVFVGLACIIGLVELMNLATRNLDTKKKAPAQPQAQAPVSVANAPIENRDEVVAAVCAAIAEANGTDISAIRVVSFKKV